MKSRQTIEGALQRTVANIVRSDPHAPGYHLISPGPNVCFDPNGAIFWKGRYHLFYIVQDPSLQTGTEFWQRGHCWGHASSADLTHWTHHPTALAPAPGDPDQGIYSGCALISREGVPTIVYHGYGAGTCIATPLDDDLITWQKHPRNPVIHEPKEGEPGWGVYNVFDPHVWQEGNTYYAILGGMVKPDDLRDTAYLFTSPNLLDWEYRHPFYMADPAWTSEHEDCACPDFFPLGNRHALVCISHYQGARCYLGDYRHQHFFLGEHYRLNWPGGACHAPETLCDERGRRLFWAWAINQRRNENDPGVMTLPRVLSLVDGHLQITPPDELAALRRNPQRLVSVIVPDGGDIVLPGIAGDSLEIALVLEVPLAGRAGMKVRLSSDGAEQTPIVYDAMSGTLTIDTTRSSLATDIFRPYPIWDPKGDSSQDVAVQTAPLSLAPGEPLRLRIFLDRSILEVFANDRLCLTQRIYPSHVDSTGVALFAEGGDAVVRSLQAWEMTPVNSVTM